MAFYISSGSNVSAVPPYQLLWCGNVLKAQCRRVWIQHKARQAHEHCAQLWMHHLEKHANQHQASGLLNCIDACLFWTNQEVRKRHQILNPRGHDYHTICISWKLPYRMATRQSPAASHSMHPSRLPVHHQAAVLHRPASDHTCQKNIAQGGSIRRSKVSPSQR